MGFESINLMSKVELKENYLDSCYLYLKKAQAKHLSEPVVFFCSKWREGHVCRGAYNSTEIHVNNPPFQE